MKIIILLLFSLFFAVSIVQADVVVVEKKVTSKTEDVSKWSAKDTAGAVYDKDKKELTFKVNKAVGKAWRLVHDGKKAIALIEGTDDNVTTSIHIIEEFDTKDKALAGAKSLKLDMTRIEDE